MPSSFNRKKQTKRGHEVQALVFLKDITIMVKRRQSPRLSRFWSDMSRRLLRCRDQGFLGADLVKAGDLADAFEGLLSHGLILT